jgi:hypothetical protein
MAFFSGQIAETPELAVEDYNQAYERATHYEEIKNHQNNIL